MEALAFLIPIAIAIASIWYLIKMSRQARERYGFGMIMNVSFVLVALGVIGSFIGLGVVNTPGEEANGAVLLVASLASIGFGGFINVRRSEPRFGIIFTCLQVVATLGIIIPIILLFSHRSAMRGVSNMN